MNWLPIAKWIGGILGGLALAWVIYAGMIRPVTKPNPSTSQKADNITNVNYYIQPKPMFGCASAKVFHYYYGNKTWEDQSIQKQ